MLKRIMGILMVTAFAISILSCGHFKGNRGKKKGHYKSNNELIFKR